MNAEDLILIPGTSHHAHVVAEMARDLIEPGLGWSWTPERVVRRLRRGDATLLLARDEDEIVGFALMSFGDETASLLLLAVDPAWRGHGVGRRMLGWLETSARFAGIRHISLEVRATNIGARAFYLKQGYRETEILEGYYRGREAAVRMVHRLRWTSPRAEAAWEREIDRLLSELAGSV